MSLKPFESVEDFDKWWSDGAVNEGRACPVVACGGNSFSCKHREDEMRAALLSELAKLDDRRDILRAIEEAGDQEKSTEVRIIDPVTGAMKGQKLERFDLIPFDALSEVARVYGVGANKYEPWNWAKGYRWSLSLGALLRHIALWAVGVENDKETGLPHMAHACWHTLTLLAFASRGLGTDDRNGRKTV